jgi:hypothetical protein
MQKTLQLKPWMNQWLGAAEPARLLQPSLLDAVF